MTEQLLAVDEIRRRLLRIRFSSMKERYAHRAPSITGLAAAAGLSDRLIYYIITGDRQLTHRSRVHRRLSRVLNAMQ